MESIGDLHSLRSTTIGTISVSSTTIAIDGLNSRMLLQPYVQVVCRSVGQEIGDPVPLQVNEYRAVSLSFSPCPIVDTQVPDRVGLAIC